MANRLGSVFANMLSVGTRALGYFLWISLRIIYRREPKLIALSVAGIAGIAGLIWLLFQL